MLDMYKAADIGKLIKQARKTKDRVRKQIRLKKSCYKQI